MYKIVTLLVILFVGASHSLFDDDENYIIEYVPRLPANLTRDQYKFGIDNMVHIWDRSEDDDDRPIHIIEQEATHRAPKTIIAVMNQEMKNILPDGEYNPFYDNDNRRLRTEFVLDQMSLDRINFDDPRLYSPFGMHMKAMSGDDYFFSLHPQTGVLMLNDIEVDSHDIFDDDTDIIVLPDFLFNHRGDIQRAKANPPNRRPIDRHGRPIGKTPSRSAAPAKRPQPQPPRRQPQRHQPQSHRFIPGVNGQFPFPGFLIAREID